MRTVQPELAFTDPRDDCPHPEHWHAYDGYATEVEVTELVAAVVRALQPELVVETGTHVGQTARAIADALSRNSHGELITLELDDKLAAAAAHRFEIDKHVTVIAGDSLMYTPPRSIDFLWLDSATYLPVDGDEPPRSFRVAEYRWFRRWLSDRAVIMIHDTGPHREVTRSELDALDDFNVLHLPTPRGVTIGRPR